jgi:uncharacterized protein (DUF1800 family)
MSKLPAHTAPAQPQRRTLLAATAATAATAAGAASLALPATVFLGGCASPAAGPGAQAGKGSRIDRDYSLANRLSWGATDAELERVRSAGAAHYIQTQLRTGAGPMPLEVQAHIDSQRIQQQPPLALWTDIESARKAGEALPTEAERKAAQEAYQQALNKVSREVGHRHLLRALYSPNQLLEQMQWFWFNHFNVHQFKNNIRVLLGDYEERAIRPHALGKFRDLLGAVTVHPAMLRYLDNEQNAAARINENHARELLELHSLGVDGGYAQRDVQELARVLTGHGVNFSDKIPNVKREQAALYLRDGAYEFNPARHDFGDKTVLGKTVRGRGAAELSEVLDGLAAHPSTARFVCGKLAKHFLADEPPQAVVNAMVQAWSRGNGQIQDVMAALLNSAEFSSPGASNSPPLVGKFKDPMHFVVSAVRACYGDKVVWNTGPMLAWLNRMGQGLYNRPSPDGYPSGAAAWSSSGQLAVRLEIARTLGAGSAGLFRSDDASLPAALREGPAFPQLARPIYWQAVRPAMAKATRQALDDAGSPQDWNALYLSAPEFMYC